MLLHHTMPPRRTPMTGSLYLTPSDALTDPPDRALVESTLQSSQFLGPEIASQRYLAGAQLLRHITFAGCSPHLILEPPSDGSDAFCHVAILGPYAQARMITGPHTLKPRCPTCGVRRKALPATLAARESNPGMALWRCPSCAAENPVWAWRWRQTAVFGRLFVAVRGVFLAEGVPSDNFMHTLEIDTGRPWCFGWAASVD